MGTVNEEQNPSEREIVDPTGQSYDSPSLKRWRSEFPYHWDADDLVSRRGLLQLAVYASGALFSCTVLLAGLGWLKRPLSTRRQFVARVSDVPEGQALYFHYPTSEDGALLLRLPSGRFVAYSQKCTHLSCAVYYQGDRNRIFCPCHDGVFDPQSGEPIAGPPGRRLPRIALRRQGDAIYAVGESV